MPTDFSWNDITDNPEERLEFGACHVNLAWRRHKAPQQKFLGLQAAFVSSNHRIPLLLQAVDANSNARNYPERGQALFAAVWSDNALWAVLCDATQAALISKADLEVITENKTRDDNIVRYLRGLMDDCRADLRTPLNDSFYERVFNGATPS